jgi:hypothetical protein
LLKPNGIIYIGIHDDLYKYDKHGGSVLELLQKNFYETYILDKNDPFNGS